MRIASMGSIGLSFLGVYVYSLVVVDEVDGDGDVLKHSSGGKDSPTASQAVAWSITGPFSKTWLLFSLAAAAWRRTRNWEL